MICDLYHNQAIKKNNFNLEQFMLTFFKALLFFNISHSAWDTL